VVFGESGGKKESKNSGKVGRFRFVSGRTDGVKIGAVGGLPSSENSVLASKYYSQKRDEGRLKY
jgi:hypothetical protein